MIYKKLLEKRQQKNQVKNGEVDLAYNMIVRPDYPSYGNWVKRGATTLWEGF